MAQNCGVGLYTTANLISTRSLSQFLEPRGYTLLGDYSRENYLYCSSGNCRFRIDITPFGPERSEEEHGELAPAGCTVVIVVSFDESCFPELIALLKLLMASYGGLVIEGLRGQTVAYDIENVAELAQHPIWTESDELPFEGARRAPLSLREILAICWAATLLLAAAVAAVAYVAAAIKRAFAIGR